MRSTVGESACWRFQKGSHVGRLGWTATRRLTRAGSAAHSPEASRRPVAPERRQVSEIGRDLLEQATGGRTSIGPEVRPGQHSPVRQARLPTEINDQPNALAHAQNRSPRDVIRAALADCVAAHTAN